MNLLLIGSTQAVPVGADHAKNMAAGLRVFSETVRPILAGTCVKCHGRDAVKSGLDLSTRDGLIRGGDHGPDIVAGHADRSRLVKLLRHAEDPHMPKNGPKLADEKIAAIARWIDLGAPYDKPLLDKPGAATVGMVVTADDRRFWSFQPLHAPEPPAVTGPDRSWARTPIDAFVLAKLREKGLRPNSAADRQTLIRRAYYDVIGLPPTPAEVEAFVHDPDPDAYPKLIDKLLASPQYGERWAPYWLDAARFAESDGFEHDYLRANAWRYRDFVIEALNEDLPYDTFVKWQLAGDEFEPGNFDAMAATGFLSAGVFPTQITEKEFESTRYDQLDDMVRVTGLAFLGMTVGCARCHDHKYDPIPTIDYYRMIATFGTAIPSEDVRDVTTPAERIKFQHEFDAKMIALQQKIDAANKRGDAKVLKSLQGELAKLRKAGPAKRTETLLVTSEGLRPVTNHADGRGYPHFYKQTYQLRRGDPNNKIRPVTEGFLQVLMRHGYDASHWQTKPPPGCRTSYRRRAMADWITDVKDGAGSLAARVIVNRLWEHHFGMGIVATPDDFGTQGDRPTHPELLEWLAGDLVTHGWRLKRIQKLILTSAVYMENSDHDATRLAADPADALLWRHVPRRLEAESIRDALLCVSGLLDPTVGGPGTLDENSVRRSVYFTVKRANLIPFLQLFDFPERLVSMGRRAQTTTSPQALLMMNSPQVRRCAAALAKRVTAGSGGDEAKLIQSTYRRAYNRPASEREVAAARAFIGQQRQRYEASGAKDARREAVEDFCQAVLASNEMIYVN